MPFTNEIAGGQGALVRNWLQSQNFVTGVSGWQIRKDGNAEFNNGTFRGTISAGNPAANHVVINNFAGGYAIEVYNASNQLVAFIDTIGQIKTQGVGPPTVSASLLGGSLTLTQNSDQGLFFNQGHTFTQGNAVIIQSTASGAALDGQLVVWSAGVGGGAQPPTVTATERTVTGSVVVSDNLSTNNLVHMKEYVVTTSAAGVFTVTHGASFTPTGAVVTNSLSSGIAAPLFLDMLDDKYTSTTAQCKVWNAAGAVLASSTIAVTIIFFG